MKGSGFETALMSTVGTAKLQQPKASNRVEELRLTAEALETRCRPPVGRGVLQFSHADGAEDIRCQIHAEPALVVFGPSILKPEALLPLLPFSITRCFACEQPRFERGRNGCP